MEVVDAVTIVALCARLLAVVLGYMSEETLLVILLQWMLWAPEVIVASCRVGLVKLTFLREKSAKIHVYCDQFLAIPTPK